MSRALSCLIIAVLTSVSPAFAAERPNILLCVADDWGWPHAGAYGDAVVQTPAFDRLAREGVLFEHAFVSAPSCTPSRNALLTGQQFYRLGQGANLQSTLDVAHPNFMRLMEQAGYRIGHWRKVWGPGVFEAGGYKDHPAGPDMSFEAFMKQRPKDEPFCFWFGASDPHRPYKTGSGVAGGIGVSKIRVPAFLPDDETVRSDIADYYFEVQRWDRDVARAIELLEQAGELENTIIVMTGDNGMPFPRCKGNLYDFGSRAPLAIRWVPLLRNDDTKPGDDPWSQVVMGRERHAAAQAMPSLVGYPSRAIRTDHYLYIMNLEPDRWPAGVPDGATHPIGQFTDCDDGPTKRFILEHRDDRNHLRFYELCFARRPAEELYDVRADPHQVHNLAAKSEHRETMLRLRDQLTRYLRDTGDPRFTGQPVKFDEHPYRDERIHRRIREWQEWQ